MFSPKGAIGVEKDTPIGFYRVAEEIEAEVEMTTGEAMHRAPHR